MIVTSCVIKDREEPLHFSCLNFEDKISSAKKQLLIILSQCCQEAIKKHI